MRFYVRVYKSLTMKKIIRLWNCKTLFQQIPNFNNSHQPLQFKCKCRASGKRQKKTTVYKQPTTLHSDEISTFFSLKYITQIKEEYYQATEIIYLGKWWHNGHPEMSNSLDSLFTFHSAFHLLHVYQSKELMVSIDSII